MCYNPLCNISTVAIGVLWCMLIWRCLPPSCSVKFFSWCPVTIHRVPLMSGGVQWLSIVFHWCLAVSGDYPVRYVELSWCPVTTYNSGFHWCLVVSIDYPSCSIDVWRCPVTIHRVPLMSGGVRWLSTGFHWCLVVCPVTIHRVPLMSGGVQWLSIVFHWCAGICFIVV